MEQLRAANGCPWDREQRLPDLRAYLLEEAHEVAAAIDASDFDALASELGDLLFQVAFLTQLAVEAGAFAAGEPIARVAAKMIERHPHVFGGEALADAQAVREAWERRKVRTGGGRSLLDDTVSSSLPALVAAYRMTQKAAGVGFDWPDPAGVVAKLDEELSELKAELAALPLDRPADRTRLVDEVGDLLFTVANLARKLELDPEAALAAANLKFRRRFALVESALAARGKNLAEASREEMEELWVAAKRAESPTPRLAE